MEQLEGSTLELIHRRRIKPYYAGYAMILMALGMIAALPFVRVDVVSTCSGMIRPEQEPAGVTPAISGWVERSLLQNNMRVREGDTLVWMRRELPESRLRDSRELILHNRAFISDIQTIMEGGTHVRTSRFMHSYRDHKTTEQLLRIERDFQGRAFAAADSLYRQEVIPLLEYEKVKSGYEVACARLEGHREEYRKLLSDELQRLEMENRLHLGEIERTRAAMADYCVTAPVTGILVDCPGITTGSALQAGSRLGSIIPEGNLVAECHVEPMDIREITPGMPVRIRFHGRSFSADRVFETRVGQIDPDAVALQGRPVYRIRCPVEESFADPGAPRTEPVIPGMTFSASMLLRRATLFSLLMERVDRWGNPGIVSGIQNNRNENDAEAGVQTEGQQ